MQQGASYQICKQCIMDTSDPYITFDANGVCNHCNYFSTVTSKHWFPNEDGEKQLSHLVAQIKHSGRGKDYDCVMGLSGGVDSSFLAYKAVELGLRPLAVHVDAGWNSELAVKNIENVVKKLGIELYTYVVNWEDMRDLQLAFLKAGVPNQDIPQDHAFVAAVKKVAARVGARYILEGGNIATESILPKAWGWNAMDLTHLKAIHKQFGVSKLKTYPTINFFQYYFYYPYIRHIKSVRLLNFMSYTKKHAMDILENKLGWQYYGGKHYESRFTKFFQSYYLPKKFGYDKRRAHLSSLIVTSQMTREEALDLMKEPLYSQSSVQADIDFLIKKLDIDEKTFSEIFAYKKPHKDYPNSQRYFSLKNKIRIKLKGF